MPPLLALDVAVLPPADVRRRAADLSAALPAHESRGLRLDEEHVPHVTLTQQFVRVDELDTVLDRIDRAVGRERPLTLRVIGGGRSGSSAVLMTIERTDALARLHESLMGALLEFERTGGGTDAFFQGDARVADVAWVAGYRLKSSLHSYAPHITLGHARHPPHIEPFTFEATTIAACHLGRFCSCRRVLRRWELS